MAAILDMQLRHRLVLLPLAAVVLAMGKNVADEDFSAAVVELGRRAMERLSDLAAVCILGDGRQSHGGRLLALHPTYSAGRHIGAGDRQTPRHLARVLACDQSAHRCRA